MGGVKKFFFLQINKRYTSLPASLVKSLDQEGEVS